jgi:hypothetical protein
VATDSISKPPDRHRNHIATIRWHAWWVPLSTSVVGSSQPRQLTNSMEQSPSEAKSRSASQEPIRVLCNPKVHYRLHKSPPLICIRCHLNLVYTFILNLHIHFNIILPPTLRSSKYSVSMKFPDQNFASISHFHHVYYVPIYFVLRGLISLTKRGEKCKLWSFSLYNFLKSFVTSSLLCPNILLRTSLNPCSFLRDTDRVSHPCKTSYYLRILYNNSGLAADAIQRLMWWRK